MSVDLLDHLLILGRAWRKLFAFTALCVLVTLAWWIVAPPPAVPVASVTSAEVAKEEREVARLREILETLHPSQNEYWAAYHHLRLAEDRLKALTLASVQKAPVAPSLAMRVFASALAGLFVSSVYVLAEAFWRASTNERPLKARVFDLRERGYIR